MATPSAASAGIITWRPDRISSVTVAGAIAIAALRLIVRTGEITIAHFARAPGYDAVRVDLEHRAGHSLEIVTPYRLKRFGRGVDTGQMAVSSGGRRIWL